jgi:DNA invertase Pin-like site-specific DNA recombinase
MSTGGRRVSNAYIARIRALESEGYGPNEIAEKLGLHRDTVLKYLRTFDVTKRSLLDPKTILDIRDLIRKGHTASYVAQTLKVSKKTVYKYGGDIQSDRDRDWDFIREKVEKLELQGIFSRSVQAKILDIPVSTFRRNVGTSRVYNLTVDDVREIRRRYRDDNESTLVIAADYGCSRNTIYNIINGQGKYSHIR